MKILVTKDPTYRLLLVGDGKERSQLEARRQLHGLENQVIFTGRVPHSAINSYYGIMDVLVYPRLPMRLTELVTPLKPLEAMAHGKAVIASDVGGHRELITDGITGDLFTAGDPAALATVAHALLIDPARQARLRERARIHVQTNHNWAHNVRKYSALYSSLVA
jgi:glycogen synthase